MKKCFKNTLKEQTLFTQTGGFFFLWTVTGRNNRMTWKKQSDAGLQVYNEINLN